MMLNGYWPVHIYGGCRTRTLQQKQLSRSWLHCDLPGTCGWIEQNKILPSGNQFPRVLIDAYVHQWWYPIKIYFELKTCSMSVGFWLPAGCPQFCFFVQYPPNWWFSNIHHYQKLYDENGDNPYWTYWPSLISMNLRQHIIEDLY